MKALLFLLLLVSTSVFCLCDRDGMPCIVAKNNDIVVYNLRECITRADWAAFIRYRNYLPELDPERELDPLITYCQDHYGAVDTVKKLHTESIKAHLDQMKLIIDERKKALTVQEPACDSENDGEADVDCDHMITRSHRPIQAEFISEERQRLRALSWWQRWRVQADDRQQALDILYTSQCPNVWEHVTAIEEAIAALPNKSLEIVHAYIAQQREITQNIGKTLVEVKEKTWEKRWWKRGPSEGYRYFRREEPVPEVLDNEESNSSSTNNDDKERKTSCTIL